jgi:hypothetical protein
MCTLPAMIFLLSSTVVAAEYGAITGQILLEGEIPSPDLIVKKGDPTAKDAAVCAAGDIESESLVVDPKSKGIANIFVYLRKKPKNVHPDLVSTPADAQEVVFDQKGCRFMPHALFLRTDQTVIVKSGDSCAHNTHTYPLSNAPQNFIIQANDRVGVELKMPIRERLPIQVKCDIHPWMEAYWLILDHPYATKTDKQGKFTLDKVPAGKHTFTLWHEEVGYIERKFNVQVSPGENALEPVIVPVARFEE